MDKRRFFLILSKIFEEIDFLLNLAEKAYSGLNFPRASFYNNPVYHTAIKIFLIHVKNEIKVLEYVKKELADLLKTIPIPTEAEIKEKADKLTVYSLWKTLRENEKISVDKDGKIYIINFNTKQKKLYGTIFTQDVINPLEKRFEQPKFISTSIVKPANLPGKVFEKPDQHTKLFKEMSGEQEKYKLFWDMREYVSLKYSDDFPGFEIEIISGEKVLFNSNEIPVRVTLGKKTRFLE